MVGGWCSRPEVPGKFWGEDVGAGGLAVCPGPWLETLESSPSRNTTALITSLTWSSGHWPSRIR